MLSSFTRDLTGAPDSYDAFFLIESFLETLGQAVTLQFLVNLNVHTKTHTHTPSFKVNHTVVLLYMCQDTHPFS